MNKPIDKLKKRLYLPLWAAALATTAIALIAAESDTLWKAQEMNLFLYTPLYFQQQMVVPGGMLTYLGTFFTQYFYYPWVGVLMLCGWWLLLAGLTKKAFNIPAQWASFLLLPIALLLIANVDQGYWLYYMKLRGNLFVGTIGMTAAVALVWAYRCLPARYWMRTIFIVLSTLVAYPLLGFYGLLATLLMGILSWRLAGTTAGRKATESAVSLLCIIAIPLVYYGMVYYETNIINVYWAALPLFILMERFDVYYTPYYLLAGCYVVMASTYKEADARGRLGKTWQWASAHILLTVILTLGTYHFWYKDYNFHKELRMQHCMEQNDWPEILKEAADLRDEPTRAIVMMKNLALFRLGRQGDEMYHYRTGAKPCATPIPVHMTQVTGRSLYYNYGQLNYCYRWCLEDGVEYGWRVEYLKDMTRCALLNGEYRVAKKYIDILKKTRFHCQWAEGQEKFLNNEKAIREDKEYGFIGHLLNYDNELGSDRSIIEQYLMYHFVNTNSTDPIMQEQCLLSALWTKDIATFWPRFMQYAQLHPNSHMPTHYQEAAYLYGHLENQVDISHMPFDQEVKKTYDEFMQLAQRCAGMSEERMREVFYPRFGHTFYYEYYLIRNQKLY